MDDSNFLLFWDRLFIGSTLCINWLLIIFYTPQIFFSYLKFTLRICYLYLRHFCLSKVLSKILLPDQKVPTVNCILYLVSRNFIYLIWFTRWIMQFFNKEQEYNYKLTRKQKINFFQKFRNTINNSSYRNYVSVLLKYEFSWKMLNLRWVSNMFYFLHRRVYTLQIKILSNGTISINSFLLIASLSSF